MRLEIMEAFTLVVGTLSDEDRRALGLLENGGDDGVSGPALRKRRQRALVPAPEEINVGFVLNEDTNEEFRTINPGGFSLIHILSIWTLIQVPLIVIRARQHNIARHRAAVHGMVVGALLIAGFFTFPFDRMLGEMLFG